MPRLEVARHLLLFLARQRRRLERRMALWRAELGLGDVVLGWTVVAGSVLVPRVLVHGCTSSSHRERRCVTKGSVGTIFRAGIYSCAEDAPVICFGCRVSANSKAHTKPGLAPSSEPKPESGSDP